MPPSHHPLPKEYLAILREKDSLILSIMGKDPYKTDPVGIPFCKPNWDLMCKVGVSGLAVLRSIGVDIDLAKKKYASPEELFLALARDDGIAFLNLSYYYLGGSCRKGEHKELLISGEAINHRILKKSERIILCGEAKQHRWYGESLRNSYNAVHPDTRCKISKYQKVRDNWQEWWGSGAIASKFNINLKCYSSRNNLMPRGMRN